MIHPAEVAREHIMAGLEACQVDPSLAPTLEVLIRSLAQAQSKLFKAAQLPDDSPGSIDAMRRAMEDLAQALKTLQDIQDGGEAVGKAAGAIAGALKTLHPIVESAREETKKWSEPPPSKTKVTTDTAQVFVNTMLNLDTDHQFYNGFSQNIEEGGIFVATFDPKPIESKVLVNFKLPGGYRVSARGIVHFVREYNPTASETAPGMGVRFTDLLDGDREAIEEYLKQREPMFYDD
ncbi:MAG: hypothetical protein GY762_05465 [Proteobacteria bacterium]|nr:hypothetical protein [Pseudomonadota bacterium]